MNAILVIFVIFCYLIVGRINILIFFKNKFFSDAYEDDKLVIWLRTIIFPIFLICYWLEKIGDTIYYITYNKKLWKKYYKSK